MDIVLEAPTMTANLLGSRCTCPAALVAAITATIRRITSLSARSGVCVLLYSAESLYAVLHRAPGTRGGRNALTAAAHVHGFLLEGHMRARIHHSMHGASAVHDLAVLEADLADIRRQADDYTRARVAAMDAYYDSGDGLEQLVKLRNAEIHLGVRERVRFAERRTLQRGVDKAADIQRRDAAHAAVLARIAELLDRCEYEMKLAAGEADGAVLPAALSHCHACAE